MPPVSFPFRVNVAENQRLVKEKFSKTRFFSKTSGGQTHEAAHDSIEPSLALSGPPHRASGPFGHSGWSFTWVRAKAQLSC